jgi:hypothetical protein
MWGLRLERLNLGLALNNGIHPVGLEVRKRLPRPRRPGYFQAFNLRRLAKA